MSRRRWRDEEELEAASTPPEDPVCPLCDRPIPPDQQEAHHLIPKLKGGRETVLLHRICHKQIHAQLREAELARSYATIDALKAHPEIARFIAWVASKPPGFYAPTEGGAAARPRRR